MIRKVTNGPQKINQTMKRKGRKILMFQLFKKLRTVREGQKNRRRKDPADTPVGLNCHAAVNKRGNPQPKRQCSQATEDWTAICAALIS